VKSRLVASAVLAATVVLGTAGCNLVAPQATTEIQDVTDGVSGSVGDLRIRNAFVVSDDGKVGNLVVSVVNPGNGPHALDIQFGKGAGRVSGTVTVDGNSSPTFGDEQTITLTGLDVAPGGLVPIFFQYGTETGLELLVPVLDSELPEYQDLAPSTSIENDRRAVTIS
jgi:hypothetical protein